MNCEKSKVISNMIFFTIETDILLLFYNNRFLIKEANPEMILYIIILKLFIKLFVPEMYGNWSVH